MTSTEEKKIEFKKKSRKPIRKRQVSSDEDDNENEGASVR